MKCSWKKMYNGHYPSPLSLSKLLLIPKYKYWFSIYNCWVHSPKNVSFWVTLMLKWTVNGFVYITLTAHMSTCSAQCTGKLTKDNSHWAGYKVLSYRHQKYKYSLPFHSMSNPGLCNNKEAIINAAWGKCQYLHTWCKYQPDS